MCTANLYDIGTHLNNDPFARWTIPSISPLALSLSSLPERFTQNLQSLGFEHLVGHHFFSGASPVFALDQLSTSQYPLTVLAKLNETDAPSSSCPGTNAEGAIKWLLLRDNGKGLSQGGIDTVYRIETAGGNKPTTCKGQKAAFEVKYSAQCKWFLAVFLTDPSTNTESRLDLRPQELWLRRLELGRRTSQLLLTSTRTA